MPQMSPINWLSMFFMFSMILMMFNIMNYYSYKVNNKSNISMMKFIHKYSNYMIWKW